MQYTLDLCQRWNSGRAFYRKPFEPIQPAEYDVAEIPDDATARGFVSDHHYSRSYPAARFRVGLYKRAELVGVAVFSHPCSNTVLSNVFEGPVSASVELGRFVLLDEVPANGETWFLGRCFDVLRLRNITGVLSFSDPQLRRNVHGDMVHQGHTGLIYQAHNAIYSGRCTPRTLKVLPDGSVFSDRAAQKIRAGERGWQYAARQLEGHGARPAPVDVIDRRSWLANSLTQLCRPMRHRGCHRYLWGLTKDVRRHFHAAFPIPSILTNRRGECWARANSIRSRYAATHLHRCRARPASAIALPFLRLRSRGCFDS